MLRHDLPPSACELSNCSPPIFDFRHHFWLCTLFLCPSSSARWRQTSSFSFSRRRRRNQISNQKAFSSLARSLTHSLHRFLKSPASVTDPVAADVWQISSGASNAMQGVYFVIGYEKEPSPLSHLRRVSPMAPRPLNFCAFHMRSACSTFQSGRGDRWRRRAQFVSAACFEKSS